MKKIIGRVAAAMGIMVILFSPLLLIVDYKRYLSLVMLIWFTSVIYYLWIKRKEKWNMKKGEDEKIPPYGPKDQKEDNVSRETKKNSDTPRPFGAPLSRGDK